MPQIEKPDDLQFIANHPVFFAYVGIKKKGRGLALRANLRNWLFARNLRPHCFGEGKRVEHFFKFLGILFYFRGSTDRLLANYKNISIIYVTESPMLLTLSPPPIRPAIKHIINIITIVATTHII